MKLSIKLYITKPLHTKYGRIPLENSFNSTDELIQHSRVWLCKPSFQKPFIDIFEENFCIREWHSSYQDGIRLKDFPDGKVKESICNVIKKTIEPNFYESLYFRHHKWIGEIDVTLIRKEKSGNFNLYLTKPSSVWDIEFAGIDRCKIFLNKPEMPLNHEKHYLKNYIKGVIFRKTPELEPLCIEMWNNVKDSFDIPDQFNFLRKINDDNHKENQDCCNFMREFFFDIELKK